MDFGVRVFSAHLRRLRMSQTRACACFVAGRPGYRVSPVLKVSLDPATTAPQDDFLVQLHNKPPFKDLSRVTSFFKASGQWSESNRQPPAYQAGALPSELHWQMYTVSNGAHTFPRHLALTCIHMDRRSGADRHRTCNLLGANQVLSHLSYYPKLSVSGVRQSVSFATFETTTPPLHCRVTTVGSIQIVRAEIELRSPLRQRGVFPFDQWPYAAINDLCRDLSWK